MKNLILLLYLVLITISCTNSPTGANQKEMKAIVEEFNNCKAEAENVRSCQYYTAKAICEYYGIDDFKDENAEGGYIKYYDIKKIVDASEKWTKQGTAVSQQVLNAVQKNANDGFATIAISEENEAGHVVIIVPGELKKAKSWNNLEVPECASLFMINMESFARKPINYAWSKPDNIVFYTRK